MPNTRCMTDDDNRRSQISLVEINGHHLLPFGVLRYRCFQQHIAELCVMFDLRSVHWPGLPGNPGLVDTKPQDHRGHVCVYELVTTCCVPLFVRRSCCGRIAVSQRAVPPLPVFVRRGCCGRIAVSQRAVPPLPVFVRRGCCGQIAVSQRADPPLPVFVRRGCCGRIAVSQHAPPRLLRTHVRTNCFTRARLFSHTVLSDITLCYTIYISIYL